MRSSLFLSILMFSGLITNAQDWLSGYGVEFNPVYGKVLKHNYIFPPEPDRTLAFDINILKQTDGSKYWQVQRKFPLVGLGLTYTDYGIDSVYGKCIGIYPVWEFRIIRKEKIEWTCRFGYGLGYVTKRFDRETNEINNLIGSKINNFTMFTTQFRYKLSHQVHIHTGFNFSHVSNGSFRLPNLGVNTYGGHIGVRYFPVTDDPTREEIAPAKDRSVNRWLVQARVGLGVVEYGIPDGPQYPVYIATLFASKRYAGKNKILAGIDYSYYKSMEAFLRLNEIDIGEEKKQSWDGTIFVGHEFLIGKFGIVAQVGVPFKKTKLSEDLTVQKLGYSYYLLNQEQGILKELTINTFIKSRDLQAANLELSIGAGF